MNIHGYAIPLLLCGCIESAFVDVDEGVGSAQGGIAGWVCDPSGGGWLADAQVYTYLRDAAGLAYDSRSVFSDRQGYWLLQDLPLGFEYEVFVQHGGEVVESHRVWVEEGTVAELDKPDCFDPFDIDVLVVSGSYDRFEVLLAELGFSDVDVLDGQDRQGLLSFFGSSGALDAYELLFLNGGHVEEDFLYDTDGSDEEGQVEAALGTIQDFVERGGALYASDWAYDAVERSWDTPIDFLGDDSVPDAAQKGEDEQVQASVDDTALAELLGAERLDIDLGLPVWPVMEAVDKSVTVHISADVTYREGTETTALEARPILVSFAAGKGRVVFASFRVAENADSGMTTVLRYMMVGG